jgi:hypothetical protein
MSDAQDIVARLRECAADDDDCLPQITVRAAVMRDAADTIEHLREHPVKRVKHPDLREEVERLTAELLAAREDARRYRWLRRGDGKAPADGADWPLITMHLTDEAVWDTEADAAIDAAIAAEAPPAK